MVEGGIGSHAGDHVFLGNHYGWASLLGVVPSLLPRDADLAMVVSMLPAASPIAGQGCPHVVISQCTSHG